MAPTLSLHFFPPFPVFLLLLSAFFSFDGPLLSSHRHQDAAHAYTCRTHTANTVYSRSTHLPSRFIVHRTSSLKQPRGFDSPLLTPVFRSHPSISSGKEAPHKRKKEKKRRSSSITRSRGCPPAPLPQLIIRRRTWTGGSSRRTFRAFR